MDKRTLQDTAPRLAIGALSQRTGVNIETVRYYERIGLLPPPARSEGGHRLYGGGHLMRLNFVRRARDLGFTLDEIRALLELAEKRDRPCAEAREVATGHLSDVRAKIADLRTMEHVLADMVSRCNEDTTPDCPLIEALFDPTLSKGARAKSGTKAKRPSPPASRIERKS
ncbi:MAG: helix-turn-helix domain-containing protein [Methylobacterium sp.]|jgi:MerR family mercuric resistance operon transcriptional regulator|uniref:MerR family transcriptional regulator n=1 Tax=Methylobacterium sp. TaxID=409 RepID=UPI0025884F23|nr:helix-turn-helix domain-containing protein [Methylobacterium sp.]MBY0295439.1 helix-turn-helix domain-containing protein [Methylobacterium sp.]